MDVTLFGNDKTGDLVDIADTDPVSGAWQHQAFRPHPLPEAVPALSNATHLVVANARAALAALDSTARRLPDPTLLRTPTLRREAQATSALEGTYAPLQEVYAADEDAPGSADLREILNYVTMANHAFDWVADGRPLSVPLLEDLQRLLVSGTPAEGASTGRVRDVQVVIGRRAGSPPSDHPVHASASSRRLPGMTSRRTCGPSSTG